METKSKLSTQWWWFDSQSNTIPRKSPWLHSTLAELDEKTEAMLKLIEEDADSFAKRAEMYYKKRPELINIVEDLYRTHRSLAEKYDQVKFDSGTRHLTPWTSCPLPLSKFRNSHLKESEKSFNIYSESKFRTSQLVKESEKAYDSYSESFDYEHDYESGESVVIDDLEHEHEEHEEYNETQVDEETEEIMKLKEEVERLREENKVQKQQLVQKDDEKREAIRQLSFSVDFLKQENTDLKTRLSNETFKKQSSNSNSNPFEFTKGAFWGRLFNGVVPL